MRPASRRRPTASRYDRAIASMPHQHPSWCIVVEAHSDEDCKRKVIKMADGSIAIRMTMAEMMDRIDRMAITDEVLASFQEAVDRGPTDPKDSILAQPWCGNDPRLAKRV